MGLDNLSEKRALIEHYLQVNRFEKVLDLTSEFLEEVPTDVNALMNRGVAFYELKRNEACLDVIEDILALGDTSERVYYLMGLTFYRLERYSEAEDAFLTLLRMNPNDGAYMAGYARVLIKVNQMDKAKAVLDEASRISPNDTYVYQARFMFELYNGNAKGQVMNLAAIFALEPSTVGTLVLSSITEYNKGNLREAFKLAKQAYVSDPTNDNTLAMVRQLEEEMNPWFLPQRIIQKLGGRITFWIVGVGAMYLLSALGYQQVALYFAFVYMTIVLYTWVTWLVFRKTRKENVE